MNPKAEVDVLDVARLSRQVTVEVADVCRTADDAEDREETQFLVVELTLEDVHLAVPVRSGHGLPRPQPHTGHIGCKFEQVVAIDVQALVTIDVEEPLRGRERCQEQLTNPALVTWR